MNTKQLRQRVLDLAIHGKLVPRLVSSSNPQNRDDEPASVLLDRIKAEKERLVLEGKIKKSKKSTDAIGEVPFDVPEGWCWCRVGQVTFDLKYGTSQKSYATGIVPVLRMGNITRVGTIDYTDLVYSSNPNDIKEYELQKGDLLFNRTNSSEWVGKTAIYDGLQEAIYAGYLVRVRPILLYPHYLNCVMNSQYYRDWCYTVKTDAVNQSNINAQKLSQLLIPLPPLAEQQRIVSEVEKWFSVIDILESSENDLQQAIQKAKAKILDLAITGKLVEKEGEWEEKTFEEVFDVKSSKPYQIKQNEIKAVGQYPVISQSSNYIEGYSDQQQYIYRIESPVLIFGDHTRNVKYIDFDFIVGADGVKLLLPQIYPKYSYFLLYWMSMQIENRGYSRHFQYLQKVPISLPPLSEQHRIVEKIDELFTQLDKIGEALA